MEGKVCKCCRSWKPFSDYYVRADTADGYRVSCKECMSATHSAHHRAKKGGEVEPRDPEPKGWPLSAEPDLTVQLLHLHMRRPYGATPGALRGAI